MSDTGPLSADATLARARWGAGWLACALLAVHAGLLAWGATRHSPSIDEVGHLAAGLSHWRTGHFNLYRVNPPLVRLVATAPLAALGLREPEGNLPHEPPYRPEFVLGRAFVSEHGERAFWYFTVARWACLPFSLLGGAVCYLWGRDLYGPRAGLLAVALWCFCPLVLANAQMMTPDTGGAAFGLLACYLFWRWFRAPGWAGAYWMGLGLGTALLCKTTWVFLVPLWLLSWLALRAGQRPLPREWARQGGQVLAGLLLALAVLNHGYLYEGSFLPLGSYSFTSKPLTVQEDGNAKNRFAGTWAGDVPVPLPQNFVAGIDVQKRDFESRYWSYLRGEWRQEGWWHYYLYGLAVKWPLGTWALFLLAAGTAGFIRFSSATWRDEALVLMPGLALFALVSSQTGFNHHLRYVLPALPFFFIWMGRLAQGASLKTAPLRFLVVAAALLCSVSSSLSVYPHSMSYFNEAAGGPRNGHAHLVDSNIDWGQDLLELKRWLDRHPECESLGLAYFGCVDPRAAGIEFSLPPDAPEGPRPGWYAVSVTLLRGYRFSVPDGKGGLRYLDGPSYSYFLRFEPVARAGYSIYVYHLGREECDRVRADLGLPPLER